MRPIAANPAGTRSRSCAAPFHDCGQTKPSLLRPEVARLLRKDQDPSRICDELEVAVHDPVKPRLAQFGRELAFPLILDVSPIAIRRAHRELTDPELVAGGGERPGVVTTSRETGDLIPGKAKRHSGLNTPAVH